MKLARVTKKGGNSFYGQFLLMTLVPLVISGIVMMLICSYEMKSNIEREIGNSLSDIAEAVETAYDCMYPGEYTPKLNEDKKAVLYKGGTYISDSTELVDELKRNKNLEISIFYYDTRLITTLTDAQGNRLDGTVANDVILKDVYENGNARLYNNVRIEGSQYYAFYMPLYSQNGQSIIGMIGVAKPAAEVASRISRAMLVNIVVMLLAIVVTAFFIVKFANQMILMIKCMIDFMKKLSANNLDATLDDAVTHRQDELGVMGRILVDLQLSLRRLIERDALTGLYNRRCAQKKIDKIEDAGIRYCVSIGDIDFFKKFNDNFGHECGDVVLKEVAALLNTNMNQKGFVARWGGEEFLLVFENSDIKQAYTALMGIREDLHDMDVSYNGQVHKVTMTFGAAEKLDTIKVNELIRLADDKLYEGKQGGRDRVIV